MQKYVKVVQAHEMNKNPDGGCTALFKIDPIDAHVVSVTYQSRRE